MTPPVGPVGLQALRGPPSLFRFPRTTGAFSPPLALVQPPGPCEPLPGPQNFSHHAPARRRFGAKYQHYRLRVHVVWQRADDARSSRRGIFGSENKLWKRNGAPLRGPRRKGKGQDGKGWPRSSGNLLFRWLTRYKIRTRPGEQRPSSAGLRSPSRPLSRCGWMRGRRCSSRLDCP